MLSRLQILATPFHLLRVLPHRTDPLETRPITEHFARTGSCTCTALEAQPPPSRPRSCIIPPPPSISQSLLCSESSSIPRYLPDRRLEHVHALIPTAMAPTRINIPPVTRILLISIIALSFIYNLARWKSHVNIPDTRLDQTGVPYLILVPAQCLYYPWTFILTTFVEQNVITLMVNLATVFFGGRYLERAWGSKGFAIAFFIAGVVPNLIAAPMYILWGALMRNPTRAWTPISGGITIQAAFLVAFKQLVPEHTVSIFRGFIKMRVKHFPAVFLLANSLSGIILGTDTAAIFAWVGLVTFWIYLRFYKRQPDLSGATTSGQGMKGDASETFAFATFFPDKIQPPIAAVCDQIFILLCNMKLCVPFSEEAIASGNEQVAARGEGGLPSLLSQGRGARGMGKREEAERRRALALKALDQRLLASSNRATAGPSVVPASGPQGPEASAESGHTSAEVQ